MSVVKPPSKAMPNRTFAIIAVVALVLSIAGVAAHFAPYIRNPNYTATTADAGVSVYFSPKGGCEAAIIARLNGATKTIDVQAYSFTNADIARALVDAHKRGVKVRVILDKSNRTSKYSAATFLANNGTVPYIDAAHAIAHNKLILIDDRTVITGSYNFSEAAENSNAENVVMIDGNADVVQAFASNFDAHLSHSTEYKRPVEQPQADPPDADPRP